MKGIRTLAIGLTALLASSGLGQQSFAFQAAGASTVHIASGSPHKIKQVKVKHLTVAQKKHQAAVRKAFKRWLLAVALNKYLAALASLPNWKAVAAAEAQLGKPYVYAASGPNSFDCSGLTRFAWEAGGKMLPHNAAAQYSSTPHVNMADLTPGDLVFFGSPIHHVGLYVGNGTMIESPHTGARVQYRSIYRPDYAGASSPG